MTDYTTHPQYLALLEAVLANPADDLPRLVLADWLEEHGQTERAEFIRAQVQIAAWGCSFGQGGWNHLCGTDANGYWNCNFRIRADSILEEHWHDWSGRVGTYCGNFHNDGAVGVTFRRGFVAEIHAPLAVLVGGACECAEGWTFSGHDAIGLEIWGLRSLCPGTGHLNGILPRLVREHPVERVVVTDREPWSDGPGSTWFSWVSDLNHGLNAPHYLPHALFLAIKRHPRCPSGLSTSKRYPTADAANAALSDALLAWAKAQPTHAVYHGDGQTYRIVPTGA